MKSKLLRLCICAVLIIVSGGLLQNLEAYQCQKKRGFKLFIKKIFREEQAEITKQQINRPQAVCSALHQRAKVGVTDGLERTPLHWTAFSDDYLETTELLLEWKADTEAQDTIGETPLHIASRSGSIETVRLLLEWKADIEAKDNVGYTPLVLARMYDRPEIAQLLLDEGADER